MRSRNPVLECIPNFSEGRDPGKIAALENAIRSVKGVSLLHTDISPAANRTVMTFAGPPAAVTEAAFRAVQKAKEVIDMREQKGVHPRIGATDVCPFVPLYHLTMEDAVDSTQKFAEQVGKELDIPVYLYEYSARLPGRKALPDIRKGQYEGFADKMKYPEWTPDFGPAYFPPSSGALVTGARDILVAFNIGLQTKDIQIAERLARRIREKGGMIEEHGIRKKVDGRLTKVRAIGWYMADYQQAQVSFNLLDYRETSPLKVWETCRELAEAEGISLSGSEVIGLIPEGCLLEAGAFALQEKGMQAVQEKTVLLEQAIALLGLNKLKPFIPEEKVLEYTLINAGLIDHSDLPQS